MSNVKFTSAINQACTSATGFEKALSTLRSFATNMDKAEFKADAVPVVATYYKVRAEETNRGTLQLPRDSAAAKFLTRLVASAYAVPGGAGNAKKDAVAQCIAAFASGARKFNRLTPAKQRRVLDTLPHITQLLKDFPADAE